MYKELRTYKSFLDIFVIIGHNIFTLFAEMPAIDTLRFDIFGEQAVALARTHFQKIDFFISSGYFYL